MTGRRGSSTATGALLLAIAVGCQGKDPSGSRLRADVDALQRENRALVKRVESAEASALSAQKDVIDQREVTEQLRQRIIALESPSARPQAINNPVTAADSRASVDRAMSQLVTAVHAETDREGPRVYNVSPSSQDRGSTDPVIVSQCQQEWGTNFRMRKFCEDQQEEAKRKLAKRTAGTEGISMSDFDAIRRQCQQEWPGNYRMQDFCETEQTKARRGLR